jgi:hypothetical protein
MSTLDIIRWVIAGLLAAFWLLCAGGNLMSLIGAAMRKGSTSFILFIGGVVGALSFFICPLPGTARWAWLPPLLDIGSIPVTLAMLYGFITRRRSSRHDNAA